MLGPLVFLLGVAIHLINKLIQTPSNELVFHLGVQ